MRRSWLRGLAEVTKRYLMAAAAHNLGRIMRRLFGVGKPRTLQGLRALAAITHLIAMTIRIATSNAPDQLILSLQRFAVPHDSATTA
jgi:hypothetical protein